jgi:hypothetical protein
MYASVALLYSLSRRFVNRRAVSCHVVSKQILGEEIRCGSGVAASTKNGCELGGTSLLEVLRIGRYARYSSAGPWSASIDMGHPYLR